MFVMPDNDDSFIEAGIRFTFDPEGFLRGSAEAQDALESTLAEMINFRREAQKQEQQLKDAIPGIASALGASVDEVKDAIKDLKKSEQEAAKETARVQKEESRNALAEKRRAVREEEQLARQQQREEMARLRERQQAIREIRDTALAAVGATSLIGGTRNIVGMVGNVAANGANVLNMAGKTGFSAREILAVGEAGALTPGSSRQEALQSMNALAQARTEVHLNGQSQLTDLLANRYGVHISHIMNGSYETSMQHIIADLRRRGHSEQSLIAILEQSGLTSGGWSNEVLRGQDMHQRIQQGYSLTRHMADNLQQMEKVDEQMKHLGEMWVQFKKDIAIDMLPAMESVSGLLEKADKLAVEHPDAARHLTEIAAVITALSPILAGIGGVVGTTAILKLALSKGGCGCARNGKEETGTLEESSANISEDAAKKQALRKSEKEVERRASTGLLSRLLMGGNYAFDLYAFSEYFPHAASWLLGQGWDNEHPTTFHGNAKGLPQHLTPDMRNKQMHLSELEKKYGLPAGMLDGMWAKESSRGLHAGKSRAGALGDFQIMPDVAAASGIDPNNFYQSAEYAAKRMHGNMVQYGTIAAALAEYNWGGGNLKKDMSLHGGDWQRYAPNETQDYISSISRFVSASQQIHAMNKQVNASRAIRGGAVHTDNRQTTTMTMHVQNVNVRANDPQQMVQKVAQSNNHMLTAASVDTGVM
ncbi:hypothetical protein DS739_04395 [Acetobacter sp. JWB]|nr:hypothetical protein CPF11_03280 [Acetobacter pomorum]AXC26091.1 hypothetical protein DS739_04395 [Acetobacter sp. JWB]KGB23408.1 Lytic transglycosylase, catalytic [Acetobacter pomorum]